MIFYFHGFSSSSTSHKANVIRKSLSQYSVHVPDYPSHQPGQSIMELTQFITKHTGLQEQPSVMLIGSSLGGFYAQYLAVHLPCVSSLVLINPCLEPGKILAGQLGKQTNMVSGETFDFLVDDLNGFEQYQVAKQDLFSPALVLLDEGDEIIDYQVAAENYRGKGDVMVFPGGDHWFQHMEEALPKIESLYRATAYK